MLDALVAGINNDTSTLSAQTGIAFPTHLTDEVCLFMVVGHGYFDFKGRDGLIRILKRFLPDDHFVVKVVKKKAYRSTLEQLSALRNFAAHDSDISKQRARRALNVTYLRSPGSWLKVDSRLKEIVDSLKRLSAELRNEAPY